jgi:hypothetical protein
MTIQAFQILISISLISVFLTGYYRPIDPIREWVTEKWISFFVRKQMYRTAEVAIVFNCAKCMAFVATLIYMQNFIYAIIASIFALLINKLIEDVSKDK